MRKIFLIITTGCIVALFPLLALPPRIEAWLLFVIGFVIIIFGLYERAVYQEQNAFLEESAPEEDFSIPISSIDLESEEDQAYL